VSIARRSRLPRFSAGVTRYQLLRACQAADVPADLVAGLTLAAIALPKTDDNRAARQGSIKRPASLTCRNAPATIEPCGSRFSVTYDIETFATGAGIREIARLRRIYGRGRWRKRKGIARVRLSDGSIHTAELHWYEATGIGRKEFKIKHLL
jgi:hypothetical protein